MTETVTRCRICGKPLRVPLSVERGVGPVCWANIQVRRLGLLAYHKEEADEVTPKPVCYGSYGSEECIIDECSFQVSCDKEETKRFEKARRDLNE